VRIECLGLHVCVCVWVCASVRVCACVRACVRERECVSVRACVVGERRQRISEREGTSFGRLQLDRYISQLECY